MKRPLHAVAGEWLDFGGIEIRQGFATAPVPSVVAFIEPIMRLAVLWTRESAGIGCWCRASADGSGGSPGVTGCVPVRMRTDRKFH